MSSDLSEYQLKELFKNRKFDPVLRSVSGKPVEIVTTGDVNSDTGPDFKRALVKMAGVTFRGDIELHRTSSDWFRHNHSSDRNYNSVILHVVGRSDDVRECTTAAGRKVETVELTRFLTPDADSFLASLESEERITPLKCADGIHHVPFKDRMDFLGIMGERRFLHKVNRFEERLKDIIDENRPVVFESKQKYFRDLSELTIEHRRFDDSELRTESYWDQLLYEAIMEGLGYSKNTAAFRRLARNATIAFLRENGPGGRQTVESVLFGASGLLPVSSDGFDRESAEYCGRLASGWSGVKRKFRREVIDKSEWYFFKLRPQNFPTIRIAGAACLFSDSSRNFSAKLLIGSVDSGAEHSLARWRKFLTVPAADYWSRHYTFGTEASTPIRMLIGSDRAEEIIVNSMLPLVFLRGKIFGLPEMGETAMKAYGDHRPTNDNFVTLLVKDNLFGGDNVFGSVMLQQGALHLYRTLCSERRCVRCRIGKVVLRKPAA